MTIHKKWFWLFLVLTLLGLLNFGVLVANDLADGRKAEWLNYIVDEISGAWLMLPFFPLLFWFFKKYPLTRHNFLRRLPLYFLALVLYGAAHTLLMFSFRIIIYHWLSLGDYRELYGVFGYRMVMEYFKQFLTFIIIYGTYDFFKKIKENQAQKTRAAQLEEQLTKARLQSLKMQLNPHFLFNTLNAISSMMYENIPAADKMMATLSDMLRTTLRIQLEEHTVENELALLRQYLDIMKTRFDEKLNVHIDINEKIEKALVPVFLLQPLVENSIKYGMEKKGEGEIKINMQPAGKWLHIDVEDNGPGMQNSATKGIGWKNTLERLEKLFGEKQQFKLENKNGGGLRVIIEIPLHFK